MRVLLDDHPIDCDPTCPTLGAAIDAGRLAARQRGRVIVEVSVDGEALDDAALDQAEQRRIPGAEVRFTSADGADLVRSTFLEVAGAMPAARREQGAAAEALQLGRTEEAFGHLASALGTWENVRQVVMNGSALLDLPLATLRIRAATGADEIGVAGAVESLTRHLQEVKRAMEHRDWTGLADVLAYDMQDLADTWRTIMLSLADLAAAGAEPPSSVPPSAAHE